MKDTCFVITPIGQPDTPQRRRADRLCDQVLAPALLRHESQLSLVRGDRMQDAGPITVQLIEAITDARLIVADLVEPNPNVYYELGIAEAFQKPVLRIAGTANEALPFDVRDMRSISLPRQPDGGIDVVDAFDSIERIVRMLPVMLAPNYRPVSIVTLAEKRAKFESLSTAVGAEPDEQSQLLRELASQVLELREDMQRIRLPTIKSTPPVPATVSLGFGREVLGLHLGRGVTVAEVEKELSGHPNSVSVEDVEIVQQPSGSKTLVLYGGPIDRYDGPDMSAFWREFKPLIERAGLDVSYSSNQRPQN